MLGSLTIGSMAAYRYGPAPETLADLIDRTVAGAIPAGSTPDDGSGGATAEAWAAPAGLALGPEGRAGDPPRFDPAIMPAGGAIPLDSPARVGVLDRTEVERLVAPVLAAGATYANVEPWGKGSEPVYRATASAPAGVSAPDLERRFDAIGATPHEAAERVAAEVRSASLR